MQPSPRANIVVADDDRGIRDLLETRLTFAGHRVHTARNGAEAIKLVFDLKPHLMVLDINMPEVDGFRVLEMMRNRGSCTTRVLVLTARHAPSDVTRAASLGAKDYLAKPFDDALLLSRVNRLLGPPKPAMLVQQALETALILG